MDLHSPFPALDAPPMARGIEIGRPVDDGAQQPAEVPHVDEWQRFPDRDLVLRDPSVLRTSLEAPGAPVDVVVDHATDDVGAAVFVFETVFARLAPGALHVIDHPASAALVMDLMLLSVSRPELVRAVTATATAVVVHRGPWPPVAQSVSLDDIRSDPFGIVTR
jgi:hypothetical protein